MGVAAVPNSGIARPKSECCADSRCICVRHFEKLQMGDQRLSLYERVHNLISGEQYTSKLITQSKVHREDYESVRWLTM